MPQVADAGGVLLDTKLHFPDPRPGFVPRPDLLEALGRPGTRLTLVDAPAGRGKTTLLGQWRLADPRGRAFAWVALDQHDADPVRFWSYVVESLRRAVPGLDDDDDVGAALRVPGMAPRDLALPELINRLSQASIDDAVLALDDYHVVRNRDIDEDLAFLIEHMPPALHVAMATRVDPALPLARMRARGELAEVRMAELRFAPLEAAGLLGSVVPELASEEVARLCERTEGWAAGLYLAALSLQGRPDVARFVDEFAGDHRMVVDYLGEEVLRELAPERRDFLLATSILERLSGSLCEAVTGDRDAAGALDEMERTNVFVVPLDERRGWYRYHHLFADLLRHELMLREPPEAVADLHLRAGAWFRAHGFEEEAVTHLLAAGAVDDAVEAVLEAWQSCVNDGRLATVERWLQRLPRARVESDVRLCLAWIWIELSLGRAASAARWIEVARRTDGATNRVDGFPDVESALLTAVAIERELGGDSEAAAELSRRLDLDAFPKDSPWRSVAGMAVGMRLVRQMDLDGAPNVFTRAAAIAEEGGVVVPAVVCVGYLANIALALGDVDEAERRAKSSIALAEAERHSEFPHGCSSHAALAQVAMIRGDLEAAERESRRALALAGRGASPGESAFVGAALAPVLLRCGHEEEARAPADTAQRFLVEHPGASPRAVADVAAMDVAMASAASTRPAALGDGAPAPGAPDALTPRELDVLRRLTEPMSVREIALDLYVSPNTVKTQIRSIYRKLGVASRGDAVGRAPALALIR